MNSLLQMSKVFNTSLKFTDRIICQAFRAKSTVGLYVSLILLYRIKEEEKITRITSFRLDFYSKKMHSKVHNC